MSILDSSLAAQHGGLANVPPAGTFAPRARIRKIKEKLIEFVLMLAALSSVAITLGIVGVLVFESITFFRHAGLLNFLTDTQWTPLFENAHYGILPLLSGTLTTTLIALAVAMPLGTISAIWLSEGARHTLREGVEAALEVLVGVL